MELSFKKYTQGEKVYIHLNKYIYMSNMKDEYIQVKFFNN